MSSRPPVVEPGVEAAGRPGPEPGQGARVDRRGFAGREAGEEAPGSRPSEGHGACRFHDACAPVVLWQTRRPPPREPGPDEAQVIGRRGRCPRNRRGQQVRVRDHAERGPGRARLAQRERHLVGSRLEPAERELAGAVDEGDVADPRRVPASTATAGRMRPVASRTVPGVEDDPGGVVDRRLWTGKGHPPSSPATGESSRGWCR